MLNSGFATIAEDGDAVVILDQTKLPGEVAYVRLTHVDQAAHAIKVLQARGAPLIGATAAYGVALGLKHQADDATLDAVCKQLAATRPTAVNLQWALARLQAVLSPLPEPERSTAAWREAGLIAAEDIAANASIGKHGLSLIEHAAARSGIAQVMTHCNAGWLATVANGTALAPVYAAHAAGIRQHVWVSETRPRNQGHLTAWELGQAGIDRSFVTDNAAGLLLMRGEVDIVIVGADRIAANGDVANKVGTYLKALAARAHHVPFYVAAPVSTIDFSCPNGAAIPIEERDPEELGIHDIGLADCAVRNLAFDVTPAELVAGIITEHGVFPPQRLAQLKPR
ncbi:MAG TPA: S-methyl-5-thioribose-1-phosphate isomerase [Rhodocyclaceae bacterium]|jgi:methylthioribose-1-phosphate isomerase|nr:S-methyl-5-thioribose-1-phosphate isomerase [Rhodocyclaceae bacterium]